MVDTGHPWEGHGGKLVPRGTLGLGAEQWVRRFICPQCWHESRAECEPSGEHLARYGKAWRRGSLSWGELLQACQAVGVLTGPPEQTWTARWEPSPAGGTLTITSTTGKVWAKESTVSPLGGETVFATMLSERGWAPVPGTVWAQDGHAWERPVRPAPSEPAGTAAQEDPAPA